ncbi:hypothetical protein CRENBAI_014408 [Crenichthys baileyi]|uniref:Uncharacterized protein n=1 Tax=Crenichthys baileyi TaxID=28760 RepID=A0AAV9RK04_9TELE
MGVIKVQALLDFLSEACRSKLCSREFPEETLSLQHQVKQFFPIGRKVKQDRITVVTAVNEQFGRPAERAAPTATEVVDPLGDGLVSLIRAWPSRVPRGVTRSSGAHRRVLTPGLASGWGPGSAIPGDVT